MDVRTVMTKVFVTGLKVQAEIGVYKHEIGRVQPLVVDVELDVPTAGADRLSETLNYETILDAARDIAGQGHIELVETFAERLARACLADARVTRARVRVEKPLALPPKWSKLPMGRLHAMTDHLDYSATEDRTMPAVVYALYFLAFATGFTAIIGVVLAYVNQNSAGPLMRSQEVSARRVHGPLTAFTLSGSESISVGLAAP